MASPATVSPRRLLAPAAVVALALAVRLLFWLGLSDAARVRPDTMTYWTPGRNLLAHGVFSMSEAPPWRPYVVRTPVYPVFLALLSEGPAALGPRGIAAAQVLLSLLTVGGAAWLAARLAGRGAAVAAGLLLGADLASAVGANLLLSEALFAALLAGWLALLLRIDARRSGALAFVTVGAASGLLTLCRPIAVFFPLPVAVWLALGRRAERPLRKRWSAAAWLLVGAALLPGAWTARNWAQTGSATLSTIGDMDLYVYRAAWNEARRAGRPYDAVQREHLQHVWQLRTERGLSETQAAKAVRGEALRILLGQPALTALQGAQGVAKTLLGPANAGIDMLLGTNSNSDGDAPAGFRDSLNNPEELRPSQLAAAVVGRRPAWLVGLKAASVAQLVLLYAGVAALVAARRRARPEAWRTLALLGLAAAYFVLLSAGAEANSRFRVAVAPELCVLAGAGWAAALRPRRSAPGGPDRSDAPRAPRATTDTPSP